MLRAVLVGGVLVLGLAFSVWLARATRRHARVRTADEVEAPYRAEIALATEHGLTTVEDTALEEASANRALVLDAGECIALVAANEGDAMFYASLSVPGLTASGEGEIVHLAACATGPGAVEISVTASPPPFPTGQHVHLAILRGRVIAPRTYPRLTLTEAQRAEVDASSVRARVDAIAPSASRLAEPRVADREHAVVATPNRASFAALRALTGRRGVVPASLEAAQDPFASASDLGAPPRVFVGDGQARLVAVVDAGALGVGCVDVVLARLDDPEVATALRRTSIPDGAAAPTTGTDPAIAIDHVCPASGLFVYTTDLDDGADYLVTATSVDADAGSPATPSHFGDEGPVILPVAMVAASRTACEGGSAEACLTLAALARDQIEGAGTVRAALEPICRSGGGHVCDVLAGAMQDDTATSDALERRACATGAPAACLRRGARFLAGASDLDRAYRTFRFGCDHACAECCTSASTMTEWELAPAGASEHPDAPG